MNEPTWSCPIMTTVANISSESDIDQPDTTYTRRARYFDSGNAFNIVYPDVPGASFIAERDAALDPATGTALIHCDQSAAMQLSFPATSPLVLASYARIRAGASLRFDAKASVVLAYVIEGSGRSVQGQDVIAWDTGDVFSFPGGEEIELISEKRDSVLWLVTNAPQLAFERLAPPSARDALVEPTHFPASSIADELIRARARLAGQRVAGLAVVFSSAQLEERRNIAPTLTLAMNQLGPGEVQAPHSHNSVAVSLAITGTQCYSMVDGIRKDWQRFATLVTPPGSVHSHHNGGTSLANWLIVQDGGLYSHCRTMGFRFEDVAHR
jgi:gentisate 1,2-dioxygenase